MEERTNDLIERHFRNELTDAERQEFEARLASEAGFREGVELHRKALQAIRLREKGEVLARLSERGRQLDAGTKPANFRKWWLGGAALALALLGWWRWGGGDALRQPVPAVAPATDTTTVPTPTDTLTPSKTESEPTETKSGTTPPVASSKEKRDRLFAQYFEVYKGETLEPSVRGDEAGLSASQRFALLYWDGKHEEALRQFDQLPDLAQKNDNQLFIKAECLLATGKAKEAASIFEQLKANGKTRFGEVVDWHLALALLKAGDTERAKEALRYVAASASSPWQVDAKTILEGL